jgi:hypothetical protein
MPIAGVNHHKKQILVSFEYPDREIEFYLYDFSGGLIRKFSYMQSKGFRFPIAKLERFRNNLPQQTNIWDILAYKNYYIVHICNMIDFDKPFEKWKMKHYFLFFRDTGELIYNMDWHTRFITITPDGYLAGMKEVDEELKVHIYKFNPKALEAAATK